jgi:hypothetical protein
MAFCVSSASNSGTVPITFPDVGSSNGKVSKDYYWAGNTRSK